MGVHEYCCCAIPLLNFGIYVVLLEQLIVSAVAGTLSLVAPSPMGTALPSFAHWLFAIACYVVTGVQLVGFIGVSRENLKFYRLYQRTNTLAVLVAFGMAAAFIGVSAGRHNTAVANCKSAYFRSTGSSATESQTLCNVFTWVVVGLMGLLWVVLAIFQSYLLLMTQFYGSSQRDDHRKYFSLYEVPGGTGVGDILMSDRPANAWDSRPSPPLDPFGTRDRNAYTHVRQLSNVSDITNQPYEDPHQTHERYSPPLDTSLSDGSHHDGEESGHSHEALTAGRADRLSPPPSGQYHTPGEKY
ncbi:hypothetical protein BS47DRAFT_1317328 [Hydnum rufescens UP504]|uniref:Transmembrane protein n=1 Tax=Hydnum rufescens UP504 TaxID=1448309 RepID=A0A9P6AX73_9AGAM|nr:hypothetical protein BS47DRAFT_1317328 [Hydnum rufescens UP504]